MGTRSRGCSLPLTLASTFSQSKVTFLDEQSYTKLSDNEDRVKKEEDEEDETIRKRSDSKNVRFSISSNDQLDNGEEPNKDVLDLPPEEPRERRTSGHWSSSRATRLSQSLVAEMEKRVDTGDISVLIFFSCANFLAAYPQTNYKHCAVLDCAKSN